MAESLSLIHRQVIIGLSLPRQVTRRDDVVFQFTRLLERIEGQHADFQLELVSRFESPPLGDSGWTATAVYQVGQGSVVDLLSAPKPHYVVYWERNSIIRMSAWNDPLYDHGQWGLKRIGAAALDNPPWNTLVNTPVTVAIVDSGLMWEWDPALNRVVGWHEDLGVPVAPFPPRLWRSPENPPMDGVDNDGNYYVDDFNGASVVGPPPGPGLLGDGRIGDEDGHGTLLAGIMFATPDNNLGLASPLTQFWPGIKFMPVKFFGADTRPTPARAKQAIEYAVANGAQVINASWHVGPGQNGVEPVRLAVEAARLAGVLVVTAAGNDGSNNDKYPTYPANFSQTHTNVLSVHATNTRDYKPSFSNYGKNTVHLGAPGVRITTTARYLSKRPIYRSISGTSAAAAFTSLAAAMVIAIDKYRNPMRTLTPQQVISHLMTTADSVRQLSACSVTGGRLNLANAVNTLIP